VDTAKATARFWPHFTCCCHECTHFAWPIHSFIVDQTLWWISCTAVQRHKCIQSVYTFMALCFAWISCTAVHLYFSQVSVHSGTVYTTVHSLVPAWPLIRQPTTEELWFTRSTLIGPLSCMSTQQSEPIIIMISHIMINQLYHFVSITDNRPKKLSYHLEIWYLDSENYHIISKVIYRCLKFIISYQNWYSNFKNYHIISKMIFRFSKLSYHIKNDILVFKIIISYRKWYWNFQNWKFF
jgi:hypothetical protein